MTQLPSSTVGEGVLYRSSQDDLERTLKKSCGYTRELEQASTGLCGLVVATFVVDNLFDAGLDENLGAFVTGEEGGVASRLLRGEIAIEDSVDFGVDNVGVLGVGEGTITCPGELVVGTPSGEAVVANTNNFLLLIHQSGADLGGGVFGPVGR